MKRAMFCAALAATLSAPRAGAATDAQKFAEGRYALEKAKDCKAAKEAFDSISPEWRKNPIWMMFSAKASECMGDFRRALALYEEYDKGVPNDPDVTAKIGELRYRTGKQSEKEREDEDQKRKNELDRAREERKRSADADRRRQYDQLMSQVQRMNSEVSDKQREIDNLKSDWQVANADANNQFEAVPVRQAAQRRAARIAQQIRELEDDIARIRPEIRTARDKMAELDRARTY